MNKIRDDPFFLKVLNAAAGFCRVQSDGQPLSGVEAVNAEYDRIVAMHAKDPASVLPGDLEMLQRFNWLLDQTQKATMQT